MPENHNHVWFYEGHAGRHWVHHNARGRNAGRPVSHAVDGLGGIPSGGQLGPFSSRKLAEAVVDELNAAYRLGTVSLVNTLAENQIQPVNPRPPKAER